MQEYVAARVHQFSRVFASQLGANADQTEVAWQASLAILGANVVKEDENIIIKFRHRCRWVCWALCDIGAATWQLTTAKALPDRLTGCNRDPSQGCFVKAVDLTQHSPLAMTPNWSLACAAASQSLTMQRLGSAGHVAAFSDHPRVIYLMGKIFQQHAFCYRPYRFFIAGSWAACS